MTEGIIDFVLDKYGVSNVVKEALKTEIQNHVPEFRRGATIDMLIEMDYILTRLIGERKE